ncbi:hypothetical protein AJ88_19355 [Mesorhizobium amorphae CCBAU 01583]|nr:hypothetical protein AJ88_19355 [Mesorhizobium amorphae CCBAU 01583]
MPLISSNQFSQDPCALLQQQSPPGRKGARGGTDRFCRLLRIERGNESHSGAGGRIGDLEAFGSLARHPVAVDRGKLAKQSRVGEAVERFMAMRASKVRGHGRGLPGSD